MADVKISALPAAGTLDGTEFVPVVQGGVTKHTTAQGMILQPGGLLVTGSALIGTIVGSASIQTPSLIVSNASSGSASLASSGGGSTAEMDLGGSLKISGAFAANGNTPQTKASVNAAAIDLATAVALVNQLRAALIANGICV